MNKENTASDSGAMDSLRGLEGRYWLTTNIFLVSISLLVMTFAIFSGGGGRAGSPEALHYWRLSSVVLPGITIVFCLYLTSKRKELAQQEDIARKLQQEVDRMDGQTQEALRLNKEKDLFLANLSHEVRTPITTILGFSEILLGSGLSAEEEKSALGAIVQNGKHLHQLVSDLLDYSEISSGAMSVILESCSPEEVIREAAALCEPAAKFAGLQFDITIADSIPDEIKTDPLRLRQVIINLLMNAIKFTASGRVEISATPSPTDRSMIDIDVSDTGAGIDENLWGVLFDPFVQGDGSSTRRHGGTGLGLTICRELVTLLGGTIGLKSRLGEGSTFTLRLPLAPRQEKAGTLKDSSGEEICSVLLPEAELSKDLVE